MARDDSARARGAHEDPPEVLNPKAGPDPDSNREKDPEEWVTGHEPMTGAQASYLKTLSEETHRPEEYEPDLDKAEASRRIDKLRLVREAARRGEGDLKRP